MMGTSRLHEKRQMARLRDFYCRIRAHDVDDALVLWGYNTLWTFTEEEMPSEAQSRWKKLIIYKELSYFYNSQYFS